MKARSTRRSLLGAVLLAPFAGGWPAVAREVVRGPQPAAIFIPKAEVDAPVERTRIVSGRMQNPTGPFVVGWYRESGRLGEAGNIVMSGHLDYWGVARAVFFHLGALKEGDAISVVGDDGSEHAYEVEWVRRINTADKGHDALLEVIDATEDERLTLITCGGDFDRETLEYKSRTVARARPKNA